MEDDLSTPLSDTSVEPVKSMTDIVRGMLQETKLSQAKDVASMLRICTTPQASDTKDQPPWYSPQAMHVAALPCRLARGIDKDMSMVRMYNEIVKRLKHPTCTMQAYVGDLLPHYQTGEIPGLVDRSVSQGLGYFDLAVISLGMDCFESLYLNPVERRHQLLENLRAIIRVLHENGTLLIVDVQKLSGRSDPRRTGSLIDGYKTTGYHSSDIVDALQSIGVDQFDILDNIRFQWQGNNARHATARKTTKLAPIDVLAVPDPPLSRAQPAHRPALVSRKVLYRAAETAQELFYVYREVVFDKHIVKAERKGNEMILYEGRYEECFVPFPSSLFPDEKEKKAVLTYLACGDAYAYMDAVLKTMLEGISSKLVEAPVKLRVTNPLKIRIFFVTGKEDIHEYQHEIVIVTLKDGSAYVIDLAGAQYGYHEPAMPIKAYERSRALKVWLNKSQSFGYQRRVAKDQCVQDGTWMGVIRRCNETLYQSFNDLVNTWQNLKMPLPAMLKLNNKEFLENQKNFLLSVKVGLREYKRLAEERGHFKVKMIPTEPASQA
ncbi:MAG: hypothetical protein Q9188_003591 [Gyalolechia gomerana]